MNNQNKNEKGQGMAVPVAIVGAGAVIALTIFYAYGVNFGSRLSGAAGGDKNTQYPSIAAQGARDVKPLTEKDHIVGDLNAPVKIVEFSDTECPFCKRFHYTMKRVVESYGNKVVWAYRHFPIEQLHPVKARAEAEALECVNELGGNKAFWNYLDRLFEITPSNNQLDPAQLPAIANYVGIDDSKFKSCLDAGKYAEHIAGDLTEAIDAGGSATPYTIIIAPDGRKFPIVGAQSYETVSSIIDLALKRK